MKELQLYLQTITRGWWIIALIVLAAFTAVLVFTYFATPLYRTSTRLLVTPGPTLLADRERDVIDSLSTLDRRSIVATYAEILKSRRVFDETAEMLQLDPLQLNDYQVSAVVLPETSVLELSVQGPHPQTVAMLANNISERAIGYMKDLYVVYDVNLLDRATVPTRAVSPTPVRDATVAVLLALVFGTVLAVLWGRFNEEISGQSLTQFLRTDHTSSAFTRSYFMKRVKEEIRHGQPDLGAIGIIQLDGLRNVLTAPNLTQDVLQQLVLIMRSELKRDAVIARWNEVSFAVLLPQTSGSAATRTLEDIQQALSQPINVSDEDVKLFLAPHIGVATYRDNASAQEWVNEAELAVAEAHQNGEKIVFFSTDALLPVK